MLIESVGVRMGNLFQLSGRRLYRVAARIAAPPLVDFYEFSEQSGKYERNPKREAEYRKFYEPLGVRIQVISGKDPKVRFDKASIEPFLKPGVVTVVEAFMDINRDPGWLAHDALGHSSGIETPMLESPEFSSELSKAFGEDLGIWELAQGKMVLSDPMRALTEVLPSAFFPRKEVDPSDRFAEIAVKFVRENGKPVKFERLPSSRKFLVGPGEFDAYSERGPGISIQKFSGKLSQDLIEEGCVVKTPKPGFPKVTQAVNDLIAKFYNQIRTHLKSHEGSFITDEPVFAQDFTDFF